jgi:DNA-binding NarL/FixJ family response regulator
MHGEQLLTVMVADDHKIVREGIVALCATNGMQVLGELADGGAAIEMIHSKQPDFGFLDLQMPVATGVEVIRRLKAESLCTRWLPF